MVRCIQIPTVCSLIAIVGGRIRSCCLPVVLLVVSLRGAFGLAELVLCKLLFLSLADRGDRSQRRSKATVSYRRRQRPRETKVQIGRCGGVSHEPPKTMGDGRPETVQIARRLRRSSVAKWRSAVSEGDGDGALHTELFDLGAQCV
jgi:hypothetical protein